MLPPGNRGQPSPAKPLGIMPAQVLLKATYNGHITRSMGESRLKRQKMTVLRFKWCPYLLPLLSCPEVSPPQFLDAAKHAAPLSSTAARMWGSGNRRGRILRGLITSLLWKMTFGDRGNLRHGRKKEWQG